MSVRKPPDMVSAKLPALRAYQLSIAKPAPPPGTFEATAAQRGRAVFAGAGRCATCRAGAMVPSQKKMLKRLLANAPEEVRAAQWPDPSGLSHEEASALIR